VSTEGLFASSHLSAIGAEGAEKSGPTRQPPHEIDSERTSATRRFASRAETRTGNPAIAGAACDFRRAEPDENIHPPGWGKLSESVISPFTKLTGPVCLGKPRLGRTPFYQIREMECDSSGVILSNIDMPQSGCQPATGRAGGSARSGGGAGF